MSTPTKLKTINEINKSEFDCRIIGQFHYQKYLTPKLDQLSNKENVFTQSTINEIVLWKVDRYAQLSPECLAALNEIPHDEKVLNEEQTRNILRLLLPIDGIQLPMASTILRFRNPKIYQIIDQRVFRLLWNEENEKHNNLKYHLRKSHEEQIDLYLKYLKLLRIAADEFKFDFSLSDRYFYLIDKTVNKDISIK